ncbi:MAG: DUF1207 domain-containing protein [Flammeovirgaceae bacterium]
MKQLVWLLGLLICTQVLFAQEEKAKLELLPKGRFFKPLYLDPLEAQMFGSIAGISQNRSVFNPQRSFLPFGIGTYKSFLRNNGKHRWEWGIEFLAITQFEFDKNDLGTGRTMIGVDYKAASNLTYLIRDDLAIRFRLYHLSAHWGDDFVIINNISTFDSAKLYNYNQFDITLQWEKERLRYYAGAGVIPFQNVDFDGFSMQAGLYYHIPKTNFVRYITGADVKSFQYFDFRPQIKAAFGVELGKKDKQTIRFLVEYFNGHQPYLTYIDPDPLQWIGLGTSFNW